MPFLHRLAWGAVALALSFAPAMIASATVVRALSLEEKTHLAELVVRAEVEAIETRWADGKGFLETRVTWRVVETLKGAARAGEKLTVWQGGGEKDGHVQHIPGTDTFRRGEQAVLFLERGPKSSWVQIGIGIGKYGIETRGAAKIVTHAPQVSLAVMRPGEPMKIEPATPMPPLPLAEFMAQVRAIVKHDEPLESRPAISGPAGR